MTPPLKIEDVLPTSIQFKKPGNSSFGGGQFIATRLEGERKICVQTPRVESMGCHAWQFDSGSQPRRYFVFRCPPKLATWCQAIEQRVLDEAAKNSEAWFGIPVDPTVVATWFSSTLKDGCLMRLTVPFRGDDSTVAFFDGDRNPIEYEEVPPEGVAAVLLELDGVWFRNKRFGVSWKLLQVRHYSSEQKYQFLPE